MGDAATPPLDIHDPHFIDYAHSSSKSAELDVALGATCHLFVGLSSGLHTIPHAFGRPCCLVNIPFNKGFPWHAEDTFLYKHYYSKPKRRVLSPTEILSSNIGEADNQFLLSKLGIEVLANSPDEITETVMASLSQIEATQAGKLPAERLTNHKISTG